MRNSLIICLLDIVFGNNFLRGKKDKVYFQTNLEDLFFNCDHYKFNKEQVLHPPILKCHISILQIKLKTQSHTIKPNFSAKFSSPSPMAAHTHRISLPLFLSLKLTNPSLSLSSKTMFPSPQVLAKPKTNISVSGSHGELVELDGGVDGEGYKVDEAVDGAAKKVRWLPTVAGAKAFTPARSPSPTMIGTSRKSS